MTIGYNYLIKDTISEPAIYKIGISGVLDKRLKQLKDGILTSVVGIWSSPHYEDLEKQLHKLFPMKRLPQSEWFKLNEQEVIKVIAETSQQAHLEFLISEFKSKEPEVINTSSALALREKSTLQELYVLHALLLELILFLQRLSTLHQAVAHGMTIQQAVLQI